MGDLLLRACEPEDLDQVARLETASFPERPYTRRDFGHYALVAREGFVVASKDGEVLGYVIAVASGRGGGYSLSRWIPAPGGGALGRPS